MCGRYRAKGSASAVEQLWNAPATEAVVAALERREVRPTTKVAIARGDGAGGMTTLDAVRWGVQPEWSKRPLLNARSDKLDSSRLWKRLVGNSARRVLFIADGWYEWLRAEKASGARPQPFLHQVDEGALFAMAGLLDTAVVDGETVPAATIITTDAAGPAAQLHNRMPVVLPDLERQRAWLGDSLTPADVRELCTPLVDGVTVEPVSLGASQADQPQLL